MHPNLLASLSAELSYPLHWGQPELLPNFGGISSAAVWKEMGVPHRSGLGGLPCEIVHCGVGGNSCIKNTVVRGFEAFCKASVIYLPVHLLPAMLLRPKRLLSSPWSTVLAIGRSGSFLASFVSIMWFFVCFTRTVVLARMLPHISHTFWDGPKGCVFIGSMMCGSSIFVEHPRRRAEMALYVLPRALKASLKQSWLNNGSYQLQRVERSVMVATIIKVYLTCV